MNHLKRICVFVSHIYGDYQHRLCMGIVRKAREYGYHAEIFVSNDGENVGEYGAGEFGVLKIPRPESYCGVILASGTYLLPELRRKIMELLKERFSCPVIDISQEPSGYPRIVLENNKTVGELVDHLVWEHHYSRICYLGNRQEQNFSELRLECWKERMRAHGLDAADASFHCAGYGEGPAGEALDFFFGGARRPQAIVCYNDRMALDLIAELKKRGVRVPEDIAVTGCDTLEFGQNINPKLTSVTFPIDLIGETAVTELAHAMHGEEIRPLTTVTARTCIGTSCGCNMATPVYPYAYSRLLSSRIEQLEKNLIVDMHMSANLQGVEDVDQGMELLEKFAREIPGCRELYVCLYENWDEVSDHIREITLTREREHDSDSVLLKLALKDGKRLPECTFTKRNILPDFLYGPDTTAYVFAPLFFGDRDFGYLALSYYDDEISYSFSFLSWLMNVDSMLKNLCDKKNMGILVGRLEDIYTTDELTGIFNRQGLRIHADLLVRQAAKEGKPVMVVIWDLDCLKAINDNFGHNEGNFAIKVLAHALENAAPEGVVCARVGGDEFQMVGTGYDDGQAAALIGRVRTYLDNYNRLHTKRYRIQGSAGYHIGYVSGEEGLQELADAADRKMYEEKKSKDKHILRD